MKPVSPVLSELARRYRARHAGRTGRGRRAVIEDLEGLLRAAGCSEGDARAAAEGALCEAERAGVLERVPHHPRDPEHIAGIRVRPEDEEAFFRHIGEAAPSETRTALATQFAEAMEIPVPEPWRSGWRSWLDALRHAALEGGSVEPLEREAGPGNAELLALLPRVLAWRGESLIRFVSCVLCGDSKRLEVLSGRLGRALGSITGGAVTSLEDVGIVRNPRSVLVHGPLRLRLDEAWLDLGFLQGAVRVSEADIIRATAVETSARRCLTVENETSFQELAQLRSGELLIQTSFPGSGTLALLRKLPETLEFHHFGDSDEAGFQILEDLRGRSGRDFRPLHMVRGRIPAEQEALGRPRMPTWPFYDPVVGREGADTLPRS
ncbi:MAG: hypothetical protein JNL10_08305 [Verrucomicrobiales bacterium]|nr:hypothetical protein [Verrucomicrobiales bacterium]